MIAAKTPTARAKIPMKVWFEAPSPASSAASTIQPIRRLRYHSKAAAVTATTNRAFRP